VLQEKQCRDRHISGDDRHYVIDVDDDGELDDAGDAGHVEDGNYDHYEDDEDVDGEKSFEEKGLLSRVTRTAASAVRDVLLAAPVRSLARRVFLRYPPCLASILRPPGG